MEEDMDRQLKIFKKNNSLKNEMFNKEIQTKNKKSQTKTLKLKNRVRDRREKFNRKLQQPAQS